MINALKSVVKCYYSDVSFNKLVGEIPDDVSAKDMKYVWVTLSFFVMKQSSKKVCNFCATWLFLGNFRSRDKWEDQYLYLLLASN